MSYQNYNEYLNHKSILDCSDERDIERHNLDTQKMYDIMAKNAPYGAIVKMEYQDPAHIDKKPTYSLVEADEYFSVLEGCDLKNGSDFVVENGEVGIAVYGAGYTYDNNDSHHLVEVLATYHFFDEKEKCLKIREQINFLSTMKEENDHLKKIFDSEETFKNNSNLKEELRGVKRLDLDSQIANASKEIEEKREQKKQQRRKRGYKKDKNKESER